MSRVAAAMSRHKRSILIAALVLYTAALAVVVANEIFGFGLFPTRYQRIARHFIAGFDSDDARARRTAADRFVRDVEPFVAVPELLRAMDAESLRTRALAAECLRRITETRLDYDPAAPIDERRAALERWRAWWEANRRRF
jgi:hypothetical protein